MNFERSADIINGILRPRTAVGQIRCALANLGDILVHQAIMEMLDELTLITYWHDATKVRLLESVFGLQRLFRYCGLGGGTLIYAPRDAGWLENLEHAMSSTTPLYAFGTGVLDPVFFEELHAESPTSQLVDEDAVSRWTACLSEFCHLSVRGVESQRLLEERGLTGVPVVGDPALYFAADALEERTQRKRLGVNLSEYSYFWGASQETMFDEMVTVLQTLVQNGWQVTFYPTMQEDVIIAERAIRALGLGQMPVFLDFLTPLSYLRSLRKEDLFIGTKLHSVVAACCVYTPAIMLGYQPKCYDFMRTMELEDMHYRADRFTAEQIIDAVARAEDASYQIQLRQFDACKRFKAKLLNFRDRIMETVRSRI